MVKKYGKYVITRPVVIGKFGPEYKFIGDEDYKSNFTLMFLRITKPELMEDYPHYHDFDMYLYFMSFDPDHMGELDAEIELGLGKEREIFKITAPTSVYIPAGLIHCPLDFKRVDKPVLLVHATMASKYIKEESKIIRDK